MDLNLLVEVFKFFGAGICMGLGAIGPSIGIGRAADEAVKGISRQPNSSANITKTMLIGQAVTESPAIFALVVAILLIFTPGVKGLDLNTAIISIAAMLGGAISMGAGALGPGIGAGLANAAACQETARNPHSYALMLRTMLIGQSVSQSTSIYALVVSLLLIYVVI